MSGIEELKIHCYEDLDAAAASWKRLEQQGCARTVYQAWDWVSTWYRCLVADGGGAVPRVAIVTLSDDSGAVALLPLMISRKNGLRILAWLGDSHFNYPGGLYTTAFLKALDRSAFHKLWRRIDKTLPGYDVAWLTSQMPRLDGVTSPFQWLHRQPSPNSAHRLVFEHHDWPRLLAELRSRSTRKRMRNEESRLSREGEVEFGIVDGKAEIEMAIDAIFRQREARFRQLGIPVESRVTDYKRFYQALLLGSMNRQDASERYYLLLLKLDGEMLASLLIAEKDGIVYPLINSMTTSRYSRWSPGDYLLRHLIQDACERNMRAIDFGLAEDNSYKTAWCNHRTDIYETIHGRGIYGKTAALVIITRTAMARRVKQSPRAFAWYQFYRSLKSDGFWKHDWKHNFQRLFRATNG